MAQFGGGKAPPPWQQRPQTTPTPQLQPSLLGQHPSAPTQQIVLGGAPQQPQYAPVQTSIIQPPGLGGLQTLGQPTITQQTIGQPTTGGSLMGQPPITCQALQPPSLINPAQMTNAQIQPQIQPQIHVQPQVSAVSYPTPRALAPPGAFNPPAAPNNLGNNIANNIQTNLQNNITTNNAAQQPQKQRVFTGTITKLCADFGFVDEDVFFQTSCVKGQAPKVCDRVLVEATYNPNMPFKWNANRVQVIPGPTGAPSQTPSRSGQPARELNNRGGSYNAVPPPSFSAETQGGNFGGRGGIGPRPRSPRRERREERSRTTRDSERERNEKEKEEKRESRKRSRSRGRSRSPPRRRMRVVPRYNVQVPKILLHMKEANVLELKKRYSNLYVPSDVFLARPLWSDTFPAHMPFQFPRPVSFHIMNKEVEPVLENDAIYDPPDVNHCYAAKVMLMAVPALEDIFRRSCALSEDHADIRECFVHPTRLINFLVGLKGKNETMAIGGYWSPSLDGANPEKDPNVLIHTAIRTCKALTGIDLAGCTTWYRFAEIYYRRGESTHKGRSSPARVETTVLFLPDVWNVCPTKLEWDGLHLNYKRQLDKKLSSSAGCPQQLEDLEGEEEDKEEAARKNPSHYAILDPKTMKVVELRTELDARMLNSKGLKSQLIARLTKILKNEQEKEEMEKAAAAENAEADESKKKEEEERKKEEERKRKEEEEKKKEEEEKKKAEERERNLLEKRYTLPDQPMIVVHPSRTAKSGKFDCTTMSLSVLLDYRQEDNKEHSFEVSLFAELFNEMLMRDFAFRIYRALFESPEKITKEEKKEKDDKKDKDKDKKEKDKKEDEKEKKEDKDKKEESDEKVEEEKPTDKKEKKVVEKEEEKKEEEEEEEEMEEEEEEEMDDEDSKDEMPSVKRGDSKERKESKEGKRKDDKKDRERREKKEKKKMFTVDPFLLLSFVYFDQTHTGYIIDRDLEDIINMLGLNLSRAQQKKLMSKVMSRDVLHYRKLTDVPLEDKDKPRDPLPAIDMEGLASGNNTVMPVFLDATNAPHAIDVKTLSKKNVRIKEESLSVHENSRNKEQSDGDTVNSGSQGVVKYGGSLVDIGKLIQQLEKSENARNNTEEKLRELQKELMTSRDEARKSHEKCVKLSREVKNSSCSLKTMEEELQKAVEDNNVYQKALNQIKTVIRPLVAGVDLDDEDLPLRIKMEPKENGTVE